ncbi:MAG: tetrahydrofolate dehydrogenase/cyclohydrolase catalytic domain-containing protein [Candidatus Bathyarchaeia archaeon]
MVAIIMDGRKVAQEVKAYVKKELIEFKKRGVTPCLATILVGEDPASKLYVKIKHESCEEVGIKSKNFQLSANVKEEELFKLIEELNEDPEVHGILVQLPLPHEIDSYKIVEKISPEKDVDGLNPYNMGRVAYKRFELAPCTPRGIITLLKYYDIDLAGKHVVIINRSALVGKPLMLLTRFDPSQMHLFNVDIMLLNEDAVVSICHSKTKDLNYFTQNADILVSAVGKRHEFLVTKEMIKAGAVVVDVGITKIEGKVYGDVDFENVKEKAGYITPNPGGVGPMTVAMLIYNTLLATANQEGFKLNEDLIEFLKKQKMLKT